MTTNLDQHHIESLRGALLNILQSESLANAKSIARTALDFQAIVDNAKRRPEPVRDTSNDLSLRLEDRQKPCDRCGGAAYFVTSCAAWICDNDHHVGLARCFCGWAASGGNGRQELVDMGETIGDEYPGGL